MAAITLLAQAKLSSGTTVLVAWVDAVVEKGDQITLKNDDDDPERLWTVEWVGQERVPSALISGRFHDRRFPSIKEPSLIGLALGARQGYLVLMTCSRIDYSWQRGNLHPLSQPEAAFGPGAGA